MASGERPGPRAVLAEHERRRPAEPVPGVGDRRERGQPRRSGAPPARSGSRPSRPGPRRRRPVVAAGRVVQREVHEPGERDRAVARDLRVDPCHQARRPRRPRRDPGGGSRRRPGVGVHRRPPARPADHEPDTRARRACGRRAGSGSAPRRRTSVSSRSHGSAIALGEQQVGGEAVLGRAASAPRRRRAGARGGPGCRRSPRRRSRARWRPERAGPVALEQRAEDRGRAAAGPGDCAASRRPRSSTSARVRAAVVPLEPARASPPSPAGDQELGARIGARRRGPPPIACSRTRRCRRRRSASAARPPRAADEDEVERAVDVDRRAASGVAGRRPVAGDLREPARQRVVGREVRQVARAPRPRGDRDDVRRVAVVGEGDAGRPPPRRATRPRRSRRVASGIAPEPRTTSPAGRSARDDAPGAGAPNGSSSGGPATIATSSAPAAANPIGVVVARAAPGRRRPTRPAGRRRARAPGAGFGP